MQFAYYIFKCEYKVTMVRFKWLIKQMKNCRFDSSSLHNNELYCCSKVRFTYLYLEECFFLVDYASEPICLKFKTLVNKVGTVNYYTYNCTNLF